MEMRLVDGEATSRDLIRVLRLNPRPDIEVLPESVAWQAFLELRRRGEPSAPALFLASIKNLHMRRVIPGSELPVEDHLPDEHRMVDDPLLADLWKAYKRCIRANRPGPASQLLREIEEHLCRA